MSTFAILKELGLASEKTREVYSLRTRDLDSLKVYKDSRSGVIYIDEFYVGDKAYVDGDYRPKNYVDSFESKADCRRRFESFRKFYIGKDILDFGCGAGDFLGEVKSDCRSVIGVELQENYVHELNLDGIECHKILSSIDEESLDVAFTFHVLEHLIDPIQVLFDLKSKIKSGGRIIIEVPHAKDFLLSVAENPEFKTFTLWSQHLILHTRESLQSLLSHCGFKDIVIEGVQRYSLANHLHWLAYGEPGGHKSKFSIMDSEELHESYSAQLQRIDRTDTLVAIAYK